MQGISGLPTTEGNTARRRTTPGEPETCHCRCRRRARQREKRPRGSFFFFLFFFLLVGLFSDSWSSSLSCCFLCCLWAAWRSPSPLPTPQPVRAGWGSGGHQLRSAAGCGHSCAARAPRGCPAAPPVEAASVPVGQSATREPPPPLSSQPSVPVGRRATQAPHHGCVARPRRAPIRRSAARVEATSAAVAAASASQSQRNRGRVQHKS